eukprot:c20769_g2_i1 orf=305-1411(+)
MEVCAYPCQEQDSNSVICHFGPHSQEDISHLPAPELSSSAPAVGGGEPIVVLDSSRIAMQIASGQFVWPILPKPKEILSKLEPDIQQGLPYVDANGDLHSDLENANLASGQAGTPMEKCKVRKRRLASEDGEAHDGDGSNEKQAIMRWKDVWVAQLIHIKGRTQTAISGPQKQRVDLWQVIKNEMARTCHGFDKDSEACRKKWRRVYKEYKDDKCLRAAGNGSQKCKFYDLMELYMGERTSGTSASQLTAVGYNISSVVGSVKDEELPVTNEIGEVTDMDSTMPSGAGQPPSSIGDARATKRPYKRVKYGATASEPAVSTGSNSLPSLLLELVGIGKEMLEIMRHYEQEKIDVLHSMKETLHEITKEI